MAKNEKTFTLPACLPDFVLALEKEKTLNTNRLKGNGRFPCQLVQVGETAVFPCMKESIPMSKLNSNQDF